MRRASQCAASSSAIWFCPRAWPATAEVVRFISQEISKDTYLNVMAQYRREYNACCYPELDRRVTCENTTMPCAWLRRRA